MICLMMSSPVDHSGAAAERLAVPCAGPLGWLRHRKLLDGHGYFAFGNAVPTLPPDFPITVGVGHSVPGFACLAIVSTLASAGGPGRCQRAAGGPAAP